MKIIAASKSNIKFKLDKIEFRTPDELSKMIERVFPHILARYTDPKNVAKGTHLNIPTNKSSLDLLEEVHEVMKAEINNEGLDRELEELSDVLLTGIYKMDKKLKGIR